MRGATKTRFYTAPVTALEGFGSGAQGVWGGVKG